MFRPSAGLCPRRFKSCAERTSAVWVSRDNNSHPHSSSNQGCEPRRETAKRLVAEPDCADSSVKDKCCPDSHSNHQMGLLKIKFREDLDTCSKHQRWKLQKQVKRKIGNAHHAAVGCQLVLRQHFLLLGVFSVLQTSSFFTTRCNDANVSSIHCLAIQSINLPLFDLQTTSRVCVIRRNGGEVKLQCHITQ